MVCVVRPDQMVAKETELHGDEHPDTAGASCLLARVLLERGELDAAAPLLYDAMRVLNLPLPDSVAAPHAAAATREPAEVGVEAPTSLPIAAESMGSPLPKVSRQLSSPTTPAGSGGGDGGVLSPSARRRRVSSVERSPGVAGSSVLRQSLNVRSSGTLRSVVGGDDDGHAEASAEAVVGLAGAAAGTTTHTGEAAGVAGDGRKEKAGEGSTTAMAPYAHHQCLAMAGMGRLLMLRGDTSAAMPMLVRYVRFPLSSVALSSHLHRPSSPPTPPFTPVLHTHETTGITFVIEKH
jgi:hypothetical protein